jgi:hypothetical protein
MWSEEERSDLIQECDDLLEQIYDESLSEWDDYCSAYESLELSVCDGGLFGDRNIWKGHVSLDELAGMISDIREVLEGKKEPFWIQD